MRIQWALDNFTIDDKDIAAAFKPLERKFKMGRRYISQKIHHAWLFLFHAIHIVYTTFYCATRKGSLSARSVNRQ